MDEQENNNHILDSGNRTNNKRSAWNKSKVLRYESMRGVNGYCQNRNGDESFDVPKMIHFNFGWCDKMGQNKSGR